VDNTLMSAEAIEVDEEAWLINADMLTVWAA
jgi:hypothetical protein